mmetsp:Transcript_5262/g.8671  ORF Transcript_5262/g.8671 Transcript_5262/m.8671 type:complete len:186 (-) Transcript_5262:104-661(-)
MSLSGSGSGSGSVSADDLHGQWEWDSTACDCASQHKEIIHLAWIECDIMNLSIKRLTNCGRILSFGFFEQKAKFMDITHDAIECTVDCSLCNKNNQCLTFDYCVSGKRYRCGQYKKQYEPKKVVYPKDMKSKTQTLEDLERIFVEIKPRSSIYNMYSNNCKHFAVAFWRLFSQRIFGQKKAREPT